MSFFKKYSGTTNVRLIRMERAIWTLIYGGLLTLIVGHFTAEADAATARLLGIVGMIAVATGVVLIYVRSRLREEDTPTGDKP